MTEKIYYDLISDMSAPCFNKQLVVDVMSNESTYLLFFHKVCD